MKKYACVLLIIIISLTGCKSLERIADLNNHELKKDQIVFHQFIAKKQSGTIVIQELARSYRDGHIKKINVHPDELYNPLEAVFMDKRGKIIYSTFIEHPLIKEYEYSGQEGSLKRKTSYEDSAIFMIRYNYIEKLHSVLFSSINKDILSVHSNIEVQK